VYVIEAHNQGVLPPHATAWGDSSHRNGFTLLLRHLVMPGEIAGTREIMHWIAHELGPDTYVNLAPQYYPAGKVSDKEHAEINRCLTHKEFQLALEAASDAGYAQQGDTAKAKLAYQDVLATLKNADADRPLVQNRVAYFAS